MGDDPVVLQIRQKDWDITITYWSATTFWCPLPQLSWAGNTPRVSTMSLSNVYRYWIETKYYKNSPSIFGLQMDQSVVVVYVCPAKLFDRQRCAYATTKTPKLFWMLVRWIYYMGEILLICVSISSVSCRFAKNEIFSPSLQHWHHWRMYLIKRNFVRNSMRSTSSWWKHIRERTKSSTFISAWLIQIHRRYCLNATNRKYPLQKNSFLV